MIRNFFTVAIRNIVRHKGFTFLNIAGLSIGLTACLLIGLFVYDEKQFDKFIPEGQRIYRMYIERTDDQGTSVTSRTPPMFSVSLDAQYPEVEKTMRMFPLNSKSLFESGETKIYEENGLAVEPSFFELFPLPLKYGSLKNLLTQTNEMIISEKLSERLFGNDNPVGRQLLLDKAPYTITAVIGDVSDFHLDVTYLIPLQHALKEYNIAEERMQSWRWQQFYTYVKLKPQASAEALEKKFQLYVEKELHPEFKTGGMTYLPFVQALHDIHLHSSDFVIDVAVRGNITYVKALTIVAIFILLIACFNFINLATAKSLQRAKEVGVRKSVGASRLQLMLQFTGETILLTFISVLIATLACMLLLPIFNEFTNKDISFSIFYHPVFVALLIALTLLVGILAGFYPAWILSNFKPVIVLKTSVVSDALPGKAPWLRHGLVVVQFALSALLIISAIVVYRQVNYLHNKDLGIDKEQIMFFPMRGDRMYENYDAFKKRLLTSTGVSSVTMGYGFPGDMFAGDEIMVPGEGQTRSVPTTHLLVDADYLKTMGIELVAGRDFILNSQSDVDHAFIINETAARAYGFSTPQNAIGKDLHWTVWDSQQPDSLKKGQVIGVVKDFNYKSLYEAIQPAVIHIYPPAYWKVAVKLKGSAVSSTIASVQKVWSEFSPDYPIEYSFLDEGFEKMYRAEDKLRTLLFIFTILAIFVGCLGLFGLAAYSAQKRAKEIGIRKVLGADVTGIVVLLSKDFVKPVAIALIIATPIAWHFLNKWLENFAYRISISLWIFIIAAALSILIAVLTVSFQAIKAAISNPVKNLRSE